MSLKAVELQVALPRTEYAGNLQNQLLQKPIQDQAMLASANMKHLEEQRKRSNKVDETKENLKADKEGHNRDENQNNHKQGVKSVSNDNENIEHPYKGHHIDLSL